MAGVIANIVVAEFGLWGGFCQVWTLSHWRHILVGKPGCYGASGVLTCEYSSFLKEPLLKTDGPFNCSAVKDNDPLPSGFQIAERELQEMVCKSRPCLPPESPLEKCSRDLRMQGHLPVTPVGERYGRQA